MKALGLFATLIAALVVLDQTLFSGRYLVAFRSVGEGIYYRLGH